MRILFHCPWHNSQEWLRTIKKQFKNNIIYTLKDKPDLSKIECAIIWNISNYALSKMSNVKILFSLGAGVDHITELTSYCGQPIIRLKDPFMRERMANHVISQILIYQLKLKSFQEAQLKKKWLIKYKEPTLNNNITVGILGVGYLGSFVGKQLLKHGYNIIGFKNTKPNTNYPFPVLYKKNIIRKFLYQSDVVVCVLPSTLHTRHMVNRNFLKEMKKKALLINVGRGSTLHEKDLIAHLKKYKQFHASLDVFEKEPLSKSSSLWNFPNVVITPHIASLTLVDTAVKFIYKKYQQYKKNGKIKSDVNLIKGY